MNLVKCMEQWLQLLHFFTKRWPLPDLSSYICSSASCHVSVVPNKLSSSCDLLTNEQGFLSFSTCEQSEERTTGGAKNYLNENKNSLNAA